MTNSVPEMLSMGERRAISRRESRESSSLRDPDAAESYLRSAVLNRCRSWVRRQATQRAKKPLLLVPGGPPKGPEDTTVVRARSARWSR